MDMFLKIDINRSFLHLEEVTYGYVPKNRY